MDRHTSISIAVLSTDQDDVALINGALRDAGHAAHCHWVSRRERLQETLTAEDIELIIVNRDCYADTIRAVSKQKDRFKPEVPIVALQATADEDAIQEAMREGACDLVSKDRRQRLQAVVSRELRALRVERALNSTLQSATEYRKQVQSYMQSAADAIALVQEGIVTEANSAWLSLFRLAGADEVVGQPVMDSFDSACHAALKGALNATLRGKWKEGEQLETRAHADVGEEESLHLRFRLLDIDTTPSVQLTITPPDKANQEPTRLVHDALKRDPATLLFHRAQFLERIQKRMRRKPKAGLHVLAYVKIDDFKKLRKAVGILNSEEVLTQFAEALRSRLHPRDVAGRFEGTSFMVLLERGSANDAQVWGNQLCERIAQTSFEVGEHSAHLTCTIGVCAVSEIFNDLEELISATVDSYAEGRKAGGGVAVLSEQAREATRQQEFDAIWVRHLRAALMDNRFRLAQLPIAGLRSDAIQMFDLLVRMIDEQGNSVLPSEFLPAAERNNMMKNIDRWMVRAAIEFCASSEADRVFVRLSRQSVIDSTSCSWLEQEFDKTGFDCSRLVLQIPERDAARYIKQTRAVVKRLKKLGVGFALEHYGTDRKRFQILDMLKPDYIKIDGELMHTLMTDGDVQESVQAIVAGAQKRGIRTIAERVENANAMAVLFQLGLDFMQGHYVHEPEVVLEDQDSGTRQSLAELVAANAG